MNWSLALPELFLAVSGLAILLIGVFQKRDSTLMCTMIALGAMAITAVLVFGTASGSAYEGLFISDAFSRYAKMLILAGSALTIVLALDYNDKQKISRFEFPVLVMMSTVGMMVMASSSNLMTLYMGLELQSLAIYVLAAFAREDVRSSEAGLKYFVLSALASGLLLYGISLVYGFSGAMDFAHIARSRYRPGRCFHGADRRHRLHHYRPSLQAFRGAVPHVDAGCV